MKLPPQHVLDLARDLSAATGEHHRITRTIRRGYRISLDKPEKLNATETVRLLELLGRADRFGNTSRVVWAEFNHRPPS